MLAYRIDCLGGQAESKRRTYEANLRAKGLELEHESAEVRIGLKHLELKLVRKFTKLSISSLFPRCTNFSQGQEPAHYKRVAMIPHSSFLTAYPLSTPLTTTHTL